MHNASIIIPVYNNYKLLVDTLASLDSQISNLAYEVIVVDNGSTHGLPTLPKYSNFSLIQGYCSTPGSYAARNVGIQMATSDIFVFLDSDCTPEPCWLKNGVDALQHSSIVGGEVTFSEPTSRNIVERFQHHAGFQQIQNITKKNFSATANLFVARETFFIVGKFDEHLLSGGDREWCWRAQKKGIKISYCADAVVTTRARNTFGQILRQTRRVTGGRLQLSQKKYDDIRPHFGLSPHQHAMSTLAHLLLDKRLTLYNRLAFIGLAALLRGIAIIEKTRLKLGGKPERL